MRALAKKAAIDVRGIRARYLAVALLAAVSATAFAQEVVVFKLVAKDGRFTPPNLEVPAGKRIKIEISNEGTTPIEFESKPLKQEKVLAPGAKSSVTINPLKPGEYPFFDEFHPDTSRGKITAR
ncbi:MAG: cupredoxin domain-containing protein [Casimicrobiaceae bacterium]